MIRFFFWVAILTAFWSISFAQSNNFVLIEDGFGTRISGCRLSNEAVDPEVFQKLYSDPNCAVLKFPSEPDFEKSTLITYRIGGDCKIYGSATATLDRNKKLLTVNLSNHSGGCRAGGTFAGWILVEKLPPDWRLEFEETRVELEQLPNFFLLNLRLGALQGSEMEYRLAVPSTEYDLKGCIVLTTEEQVLIKSDEEYLSTIRRDAQYSKCKDMIQSLDLKNYAYVGVNLKSGYCRRPEGLRFRVSDFGGSKKYVVKIGYTARDGATCRALSSYDLWLRIPNSGPEYTLLVRTNSIEPAGYTLN